MPDDHSDLVPLLPIPNRTVKRVIADDSADTLVKVGHRKAITAKHPDKWRSVFFSTASSAKKSKNMLSSVVMHLKVCHN